MIPQIKSFEEYKEQYRLSVENPEAFWADLAEHFIWQKKWSSILDWNFKEPMVKWFGGGKLNITENCLDRHQETLKDQTAIIWEPNDPNEQSRHISYGELYRQVQQFANVLLAQGVKKGDRICIYLPMVPEAAVAMLACARVGAIHSVVFAGFSSQSLADRMNDAACKLLITADGMIRGEKKIELKQIADEAMLQCKDLERCIVYNHKSFTVEMKPGRDLWWNVLMDTAAEVNEAESMNSEDPLFILYTSGSTGKPKGVLHTTAGYMVYF